MTMKCQGQDMVTVVMDNYEKTSELRKVQLSTALELAYYKIGLEFYYFTD